MRLKTIAGRRRLKDGINVLGSKAYEEYFEALLKTILEEKKEKFHFF